MKGQVVHVDNSSITIHEYGKVTKYNHSLSNILDEFYLVDNFKRYFKYHEYTQRLMRYGISSYHIKKGEGFLIADKKVMYREKEKSPKVLTFVKGSRPLVTCVKDDVLFYGEYISNPNRRSISIFSVDKQGNTNTVCIIEGIRHIHAIIPYSNHFLVTTGDMDNECKLIMVNSNTGLTKELVGGNQTWRMVEPIIIDDSLFYASDSPDTKNYLYKYSIQDGVRKTLVEIAGPVFYMRRINRTLIFSSVAEPSKLSKVKNRAVLYKYDIDSSKLESFNFKKDILPSYLFQYGQILFPTIDENFTSKEIWYYPRGLYQGGRSHILPL